MERFLPQWKMFATISRGSIETISNQKRAGCSVGLRIIFASTGRRTSRWIQSTTMMAELDRRFGIPGIARVCEGNGAMPRVQITSSLGEGEMYLHGAHVTSWKPAGADEVLFLSSKSRWEDGQAIRGGIPICFPWFRAKVNDPQSSSARIRAHKSVADRVHCRERKRSCRQHVHRKR